MSTNPPVPTPDTPARAVFRRALRDMLVLVGVLAVLGPVLGWLVAGQKGLLGALVGVGVALVFSGTTVVSMLVTADAPPARTAAVVLGAWLVKMVLLVALFVVLGQGDAVDRPVLAVVLLVGVLGSVVLDYRAVAGGRVPYVEPADRGPATDA